MKQNKVCRYPVCAEKQEYCCYFRAICSDHDRWIKAQEAKENKS